MDLLDRGLVAGNRIPLNDDFRRYFEVVRQHDDKPSVENPFLPALRRPLKVTSRPCVTAHGGTTKTAVGANHQ
jgi:hypothetical protein